MVLPENFGTAFIKEFEALEKQQALKGATHMSHDFTPDFSEAVELSNEQVPPGVYNVRVDSYQPKTSAKGAAYLQWKLIIFGADGDLAKQNNRPLFLTTMLSGPGAGILKQFLQAGLGEVPKTFEPGWPQELIGRQMQVTTTKNIKPDGTEGFPNVKSMKAI